MSASSGSRGCFTVIMRVCVFLLLLSIIVDKYGEYEDNRQIREKFASAKLSDWKSVKEVDRTILSIGLFHAVDGVSFSFLGARQERGFEALRHCLDDSVEERGNENRLLLKQVAICLEQIK
ncbi:hypothetical protein ACJJIF_06815 [Microbulbifer sp. SSSA002]|uniref:hypothetical protein n=1 Tax=Microbulbifer sp. SSSA002 TaxID=3243376 RepID=UPI00403942FC